MRVIIDYGKPVIVTMERGEFGDIHEVHHVIDFETAIKLRDELVRITKLLKPLEEAKKIAKKPITPPPAITKE